MKALCPFMLMLLCISVTSAQDIKVVDRSTREPLPTVTVYGTESGHAEMSDEEGVLSLSGFQEKDSLCFQLIGYRERCLSYKQAAKKERLLLPPKVFDTEEVVISGNRWERSRKDLPHRISTIDREEMRMEEPQTAADLLGETGEVYIQKSQLGGGSPMLRGFAANRVLLVVDGVRMNNAIFRSGNLQNVISIDAHSVESAEVLFGPGSLPYGSDALGGVMEFHTLEAELAPSDTTIFSAEAMSRYASANTERTGHLSMKWSMEEWATVTSLSYSKYGDQEMGSHGPDEYLRPRYVERVDGKDSIRRDPDPRIQSPTGFEQFSLLQKLRYRPNEHWDFQYGFRVSATSDIPRYDRLIVPDASGGLKNAEWYYGPQTWSMSDLRASYEQEHALFDRSELILSGQSYEESRHDRGFGSLWKRHRTEEVEIYSLNWKFSKKMNERLEFYYGTDVTHNEVGSEASMEQIESGEEEAIGTRYPDGSTWSSYGAYLMARYRPSDRITLNGGLRYDRVRMDGRIDTSFYPLPFSELGIRTGAPSGNLGAVFRPEGSWRIRVNGASGFRAPNIDDAAKVFDSEPGRVVIPNADLGPEYAYNGELSVSKTFDDRFHIGVTGYYSYLDRLMVRRGSGFEGTDSIVYDGQLSEVQAMQNVGNAEIYGLQSSLRAHLGHGFRLKGHYNWTRGFTSEGEAVRHVAPVFGNLALTWERRGLRVRLKGRYNGEIPYQRLAPSERGKSHLYAKDENGRPYSPEWWTLDLKSSYELLDGAIELGFGVENILDQRYRTYSSGIAAPGRNWVVSVRGKV